MDTKIIKKAFLNKKNKQLTITLPKKKLKLMKPTLKFGEDLFVEIKVFNRPGGKRK